MKTCFITTHLTRLLSPLSYSKKILLKSDRVCYTCKVFRLYKQAVNLLSPLLVKVHFHERHSVIQTSLSAAC